MGSKSLLLLLVCAALVALGVFFAGGDEEDDPARGIVATRPVGCGSHVYFGGGERLYSLSDTGVLRVVWREEGAALRFVASGDDGQLFFVAQSLGRSLRTTVYCFDVLRGEVLWERRLGKVWPVMGLAVGDAAVLWTDCDLWVMEKGSGNFLWEIRGNYFGVGGAMSPRIAGGLVVYSVDPIDSEVHRAGKLVGAEVLTGSVVFEVEDSGFLTSTPLVSGEVLWFLSKSAQHPLRLRCWNLRRNEEEWSYWVDAVPTEDVLAVSAEGVLVAVLGGKVIGFDGRGGEVLWEYDSGAEARFRAPVILQGGEVFCLLSGDDSNAMNLTFFDVRSGARIGRGPSIEVLAQGLAVSGRFVVPGQYSVFDIKADSLEISSAITFDATYEFARRFGGKEPW